jgi:hypothetical protein
MFSRFNGLSFFGFAVRVIYSSFQKMLKLRSWDQ